MVVLYKYCNEIVIVGRSGSHQECGRDGLEEQLHALIVSVVLGEVKRL